MKSIKTLFERITERTGESLSLMREKNITLDPRMKIGFVYRIRSKAEIARAIRELRPTYSIDYAAIDLPETKEIMILNEIEMEAPELKTELQNVAFIPTKIIDKLKEEAGNLEYKEEWEETWEYIKKEKPYNLPYAPSTIYKDTGWISYPDFLGYKSLFREVLSYIEAKKIVLHI